MNGITFSNFTEYNNWQVVALSPPNALLTAATRHWSGCGAADLVARQRGLCPENKANKGPICIEGTL